MRQALNDNPIAQIAVLGALAVVVAFMLMTRVAGSGGGESSGTSTTPSDAGTTPAPAIDSASTAPDAATGSAEAPSTATSPTDGTAPPADAASMGEFAAGPGLPAPVVKAYKDGKTVALLVQRRRGIDDDQLRQNVQRLGGKSGVALFVTNAGHIARYSRITQGVNVDRVPALIVLQPRRLTKGPMPKATLSYGFRGPQSVEQAIRDALYKGPSDLPYYPR